MTMRRWRGAVPPLVAGVLLVVSVGLAPEVAAREQDDTKPKDAQPYAFSPQGVSEPRFPVATESRFELIEAPDGVEIAAEVWQPDTSSDPAWKQPVILVFGPYADFDPPSPQIPRLLVERYTPRGYTVVAARQRGTGGSGGCWDSFGSKDAADFATVVNHFAAPPWSGRVGAIGGSLEGVTINAALTLRDHELPLPLTTAVIFHALSGVYDYYGFDGVPYDLALAAPAQMEMVNNPASSGRRQTVHERVGCRPAWSMAVADQTGTRSAFFAEREFRTGAKNVDATVLYLAGLRDRTIAPIALDGWYDEIPVFKRALLNWAGHVQPWALPPHLARDDWWSMVDAWFDEELLGLDTGIRSWPPVQVQDEHNVWRAVASVADMGQPRTYHLGDGGHLTDRSTGGTAVFTELGPAAAWTSQPLAEPLHLSGQARLTVPIILDRDDANFVWMIDEVQATGATRTLVKGYLSAEHRDSLEQPTPVPAGEQIYRLRTHYFDSWLEAGSRIRITLAGHDRPPPPGDLQASGLPANNAFTATVRLDGASATLPIANDTCGLTVAQTQPPRAPVPGCPKKIWSKWN